MRKTYRYAPALARFALNTAAPGPRIERESSTRRFNTFNEIDPTSLTKAPVDLEGETTGARLARRKQRWIPNVHIAGVAPIGATKK